MTCSVCGQALPEGARFCPSCGTPVTSSLATEERKVVTVLFADLVNSTGLAQRLDAERAREVLGAFYDVTSEELLALRGRPEKFIGDAVMAVFGLPNVHEDDAVRAVRAGLAIRDRTRRLGRSLELEEPLEVRVGIESGEAATGVGPTGQFLVTGSVVNAAARLQGAAAPGEVLVGETAHVLTETSAAFDERRDVEAKGFGTALAAYPVVGLTRKSVRRTIPFVGRANELRILRERFGSMLADGRPQLLTLVGEPGIGKSRLVDEFIAGLDRDVTVLVGRSRFYGDSATFAPVATMIGTVAGIDDDDPPEKVVRRITEVVERYCDAPDRDRAVERLALALGIAEKRRDESAFVQDVERGFVALIEGIAAAGPVVLAFEDVQTLRPPMLDLIERLASRIRVGRALIMAVGRSQLLEERPDWGGDAVDHSMLRLEPLATDDALDLVRQASGGRIDEAEVAPLAKRTAGNPFFIVETTGMLIREGDGAPAGAGVSLPPTVQAVVAARLDGLPPTLRDLARRVSVFLYSFDLDEVALVEGDGVERIQELVDAEIVVREEAVSKPTWRFRHDILRRVAYASLPKRERSRLHAKIADRLIESGHLAFGADHMELAAIASLDVDPADRSMAERATDALAAAGDRARRRLESRSAVDYYVRAQVLAGPQERWGVRESRILAGLGEAKYWLGEYAAAIEVLDQAVALGQRDAWTLAHALRFRGDIAINFEADLDRASTFFDRSLRASEELDEPWGISRTLLFAGWVPWTRGNYRKAEPIWQRALALAEEHHDRWANVRALTALSINHADMKDFEGATRFIDQAQALAEEMGDQFSLAVTAVQRGRLYEDLERFEEAIPCFEVGISIFADFGARWELADATAERGIVYRELGRLDEAEDDLRHAIRISEELGERQLGSWTWRALARVAERRGDKAAAEERFRRAEQEEARGPR